MKVTAAALFIGAASAGVVNGWGASNSTGWGEAYTTEVVTAYTTYCPEATTFSHGSVTYTVTEVCEPH